MMTSKAEQLVDDLGGKLPPKPYHILTIMAATARNVQYDDAGTIYTFKDGSQLLINRSLRDGKMSVLRRFDPAVVWRVICKDDAGDYTFATEREWVGKGAAETYARSVAADRKALVFRFPRR